MHLAIAKPHTPADVIPAVCLGAVSIAFAPFLHAVSPAFAIGVEALIALAIALVLPAYATSVAVFVLLFQNLFVSISSPLLSSPSELEFVKGYNFLVCAVMWLATITMFLLRQRDYSADVNHIMWWSMAALGAVMLHFAIGFAQNPVASSIYLRNIVLPLQLFQLALLTASMFEVRVTPFLVAVGVALFCFGYVELLFRDFWLTVTNGYAFWHFDELKATHSGVWEAEMRATGNVPVDLKDRFRFSFLNTPLLEDFGLSEILRIFGPNMSAISFGYGVGFFSLFLFSVGRPWLAASALPLLVLCSVKGALIMMIFVGVGWIAARLIGPVLALSFGLVALVAYVIFAIRVGLQIGDYHVIGFMGGWNGFLQNPFGRGLGVGGNLSESFFSIDWSAAQQAGTVEGAVESAVGVMLYQMGMFALAPLGFWFWMAMKAWRLYASSGNLTQGLAGFGVIVVLFNGFFQEEALFAPPALGLLLCLTGLVIGNHIRTEQFRLADTERPVSSAAFADTLDG